jgi:serpin B
MRNRHSGVYYAPLLLTLVGCAGDPTAAEVLAARRLPPAVADDAAAIARSSNQFACDLYRALATDANLVVSPFSISTALAMVDAGAAGTTDQELRTALHVELPGERMHAAYGAILASLDIGRGFGAYSLATADRLFGQIGHPFLPSFLLVTRRDYGAELMPVDFVGDAEAARGVVNAWVAERTDDQIRELFAAGAFDELTRLVAANAISFKGRWHQRFDPANTRTATFWRADGSSVQTPMMHRMDTAATGVFRGGHIGVLPFQGEDLSMVFVLPETRDGLAALEAQLSGDALTHWIGLAAPTSSPVDIVVPRFNITSALDLPPALEALGITSAFDPSAADFSALDGGRDLYVSHAVHQATIAVDEQGAEAAAATGIVGDTRSGPQDLVVDRPFVFAIYDHVTGTILFLGHVTDPTAAR